MVAQHPRPDRALPASLFTPLPFSASYFIVVVVVVIAVLFLFLEFCRTLHEKENEEDDNKKHM